MIRYFRYTIEWGREQAGDVVKVDIPDGTSPREIRKLIADIMYDELVNDHVSGECREISKEEFHEVMT